MADNEEPKAEKLARRSSVDLGLLRALSGSRADELLDLSQHANIETIEPTARLWYKEAVFYEVYVRAFCDSNGDGFGDLRGLTSRLDYLSALGVNCIWLLPIFPSPLKDDGYDVSDYYNVHPHYGTLDDYKTLVKAVHERNMRVIADFIPNHTSGVITSDDNFILDQHEWFQKARADKNSPYRDYYVWSDDPTKYKDARIIFIDTEKSNWTWDEKAGQYYWHRFYSSQPDLNFENPKVKEELLNIMRFWLDMGTDGFRVDAVPYLFEEEGTNCENLPQTHEFLKEMRRMMDTEYPGRLLLAEACQMPAEVREYFGNGDEFHMGFHFPVMPRIYMSVKAEDCSTLKQILEETPEIPETCQWAIFLRNHDELTLEMVTPEQRQWMWKQYAPEPRMKINLGIRRRLAPLMDNDRRLIELVHAMLFSLPGSPILYYGDEIGMGDNIWLEDRNGVRTPMQWDHSQPHAGFSTAKNTYAPVINSPEYNPLKVNVKDSAKDPSSLYNMLSFMIATRRKHSCFGFGKLLWIDNKLPCIASWARYHGGSKILFVCNISKNRNIAKIDIPRQLLYAGCKEVYDVFTDRMFEVKGRSITIDCAPFEFFWINLEMPLASC